MRFIATLLLCLLATSPALAASAPGVFIPGPLKCAANVNAALAERGIQGSGSNLAKSFLRWGHASPPVPGAVAVYNRGGIYGHAAIVSRVEGDLVYVWNPTRHGWREMVYRKRPLAYRSASGFSAFASIPAATYRDP